MLKLFWLLTLSMFVLLARADDVNIALQSESEISQEGQNSTDSSAEKSASEIFLDVAGQPESFAVCKSLDVITTSYVLRSGIGYEQNPITAKLIASGFGPLVAISVAIYWHMKIKKTSPKVNAFASSVTCAAALGNALITP
jgi:hypothetical protein